VPTLAQLTRSWLVAVGSDSGLGGRTVKIDLRGDGFIFIGRDTVTNEDRPADLTISGKISLIEGILTRRLHGPTELREGRLSIRPLSLAVGMQAQLDALIARLDWDVPSPAPTPRTESAFSAVLAGSGPPTIFEPGMIEQPGPADFVPDGGRDSLLVRTIDGPCRHTSGRLSAQVVRPNPAMPFTQHRVTTAGMRLGLLVTGMAWVEIDGVGEVCLGTNDAWCLPAGTEYTLVESSDDVDIVEFDISAAHAPTGGAEPVVMHADADSYAVIPHFDAAMQRDLPGVARLAGGAAFATMLRGNPPIPWISSPWQANADERLTYVVEGSGHVQFEGLGVVDVRKGACWYQPPYGRYRLTRADPEFETITVGVRSDHRSA
jgi:hypothetical protein